MGDRTIIGSLLALLSGTCRHCGCPGDSCSIGGGERCGFVDLLRTVCNNPACVTKEMYRKQDEERAAKRKAAEEERLARMPYWMRQRKAQQKISGQKRKRRKVEARTA